MCKVEAASIVQVLKKLRAEYDEKLRKCWEIESSNKLNGGKSVSSNGQKSISTAESSHGNLAAEGNLATGIQSSSGKAIDFNRLIQCIGITNPLSQAVPTFRCYHKILNDHKPYHYAELSGGDHNMQDSGESVAENKVSLKQQCGFGAKFGAIFYDYRDDMHAANGKLHCGFFTETLPTLLGISLTGGMKKFNEIPKKNAHLDGGNEFPREAGERLGGAWVIRVDSNYPNHHTRTSDKESLQTDRESRPCKIPMPMLSNASSNNHNSEGKEVDRSVAADRVEATVVLRHLESTFGDISDPDEIEKTIRTALDRYLKEWKETNSK